MRVEVTEFNIDYYDLVKLTGNTKEELLKAAERAEDIGEVLHVVIPDPDGPGVNIFEHFDSSPSDVETLGSNPIYDNAERYRLDRDQIRMHVDPNPPEESDEQDNS